MWVCLPTSKESVAHLAQLEGIVRALDEAKLVKGKPVLVNIRTVIGIYSAVQGTGKAHGAALGDSDVANVKKQLGFDPSAKFAVPSDVYKYFAPCKPRGAELEAQWNQLVQRYCGKFPEDGAELKRRIAGRFRDGWEKSLPAKSELPTEPAGTRVASGIVVEALVPKDPAFLAGSADLIVSTFVGWKGMTEFQKPDSGLGDYAGRQIRYGIREHAMVAVANGISAYNKGTFLP